MVRVQDGRITVFGGNHAHGVSMPWEIQEERVGDMMAACRLLRQHDIGDDVVCHGDGNTMMVQLKRAAEVNGFLFQQGGLFVVKAEGSSYKWFEVRSKGGSVKAA